MQKIRRLSQKNVACSQEKLSGGWHPPHVRARVKVMFGFVKCEPVSDQQWGETADLAGIGFQIKVVCQNNMMMHIGRYNDESNT